VTQTVTLDDGSGSVTLLDPLPSGRSADAVVFTHAGPAGSATRWRHEASERAALGRFVGARSGDKGGNANVGLWVRPSGDAALDETRFEWLVQYLTAEQVHTLLPETARLPVDVHVLANLRSVNVVVHGLLGRGVADSTSLDPQAKGLGEHLRARLVDIPVSLLRGDGDA
jgi:hypothetical protein